MTDQEYVQSLVERSRAAQQVYADFSQKDLDRAARAVAKCVYDNAEMLAVEAVEETHMGTVEGKIKKMRSAMVNQWAFTKNRPSKGVVGWEKGKLDRENILKIAKPAGVIACVMPTTNPTTNMGANGMQCLKGGNSMIVCPHPRAYKVSMHCAELMRAALKEVGAPEDLVICCEDPSMARTQEVMKQCDVVVATGGPGVVKAANSSGNPSLGVGQGNCQVVIDKGFADQFDEMAADMMANRAYDSGIPCTGEQTIILPKEDKAAFVAAVNRNHGYFVDDKDAIQKLRELLFLKDEKTGGYRANPDYVGKDIYELASLIGVTLPEGVLSMVVDVAAYGKDELLCKEKMVPVASLYCYEGDWEEAVQIAKTNLLMEGAGHSTDIYTKDQDKQLYAGLQIPVVRLPVNSGQGLLNGRPYYAGGMTTTSGLGCGYWQSNALAGNLSYRELLNYTLMLYKLDTDRPDPTPDEVWAEDDVIF